MEINYNVLAPVLVAVAALIIYLFQRNKKDEKKFEKGANKTDAITKKHKDEQI